MEEFNGRGYSKSPITGDEAAQHRHMYASVSLDWLALKKFVTVINAVGVIYDVIKFFGPVILTLAGVGYFLKSQGWI